MRQMETAPQPPLALRIPEMLKLILSFCTDNASAYYVCIEWFHTLDRLLAANETKGQFTYARQTAAALRLGFKLRDWQGYRFLMRAKGHRLINKRNPRGHDRRYIFLDDLVGDPGGVNGKFAYNDLSVNERLHEFHNIMQAGAVLAKKVKVLEISLDLTSEVSFEYEVENFEDFKEFAAIDIEAVSNGIHNQDLPPEALMNGVAIELPSYSSADPAVDIAAVSSLEQALGVAEAQGRVIEIPWVTAITADPELATQTQNVDAEEIPWPPYDGHIPWPPYGVDIPWLVWPAGQHPPESFRDGLGVEMVEDWTDEAPQPQLLAHFLTDEWFGAREQVARSRRIHAAVEPACDAAAAGDLKEMLKNMCVSGHFDADAEELDLVWGTANRVKIEREFRQEPKWCKIEYVWPKQPEKHDVERRG